jgi:signal transduction histidine kinase
MLVAAIGSTGAQQSAMAALLKHGDASMGNSRPRFDFKDFATQLVPLSVRDDTTFTALLQRDLKDAFEPLQRLSTGLALIGAFTLAVALLFSFWIARSISRPVALLSDLTRKIEVGDYSSSTIVRANDEIGSLANRFDMMREAIAARTSEIQNLNETLEHRIKARTEELASANRDLEAFSYTVSHDLRAPLRRIDGYALFLIEDHAKSLDEEGRNYLMRIRDSTSKMDRLITDLIAFSRLSRQEIRNEEVDLSALAKQVAASLTDIVPKRNVTWRIEPNLTARADAGLMRIVLDNLLGNAWKYTGKRDRAEIDFFSSNKLAHRRTFCVRDNGAGFDMAYAENLFQPFKRLHTSQQFEGIGIGLATVRRIVERHGGRIWADGTPDAGATFYFELGADKIIEA